MAWTTPFLLTFAVIPVFPVLALVFNSGPNVAMALQKRNEEWGPIPVLPPVLLGQSPVLRVGEWVGKMCCVVFTLAAYMDLLGWCCRGLHFNRNMELWNHLGWTFKVHLLQLLLPCSGTSSSRSGCSRPRPTWFWTLWIAPRLLWPFSLLRLIELTGSVAWSLCKTFFHFFLFLPFCTKQGQWRRSQCVVASLLWVWTSILCFAATADSIWLS